MFKSVIIQITKGIKRMGKLFNSKKEEDTVATQSSVTPAAEVRSPKFSRNMVGTYKDPKNGEWMICHVAFDPATLQLSTIVIDRAAGNIEVMRERLQIKQATLGLLEDGDFTNESKPNIY
jgi:hypothetical protein